MGRKAVDNLLLDRWRRLDAAAVLLALSDHAKQDREYVPAKNAASTRWHVCAYGAEYEIVCTGPKFLDTRRGKGGGGAVDLAMHLLGSDFKGAVAALMTAGL